MWILLIFVTTAFMGQQAPPHQVSETEGRGAFANHPVVDRIDPGAAGLLGLDAVQRVGRIGGLVVYGYPVAVLKVLCPFRVQ